MCWSRCRSATRRMPSSRSMPRSIASLGSLSSVWPVKNRYSRNGLLHGDTPHTAAARLAPMDLRFRTGSVAVVIVHLSRLKMPPARSYSLGPTAHHWTFCPSISSSREGLTFVPRRLDSTSPAAMAVETSHALHARPLSDSPPLADGGCPGLASGGAAGVGGLAAVTNRQGEKDRTKHATASVSEGRIQVTPSACSVSWPWRASQACLCRWGGRGSWVP